MYQSAKAIQTGQGLVELSTTEYTQYMKYIVLITNQLCQQRAISQWLREVISAYSIIDHRASVTLFACAAKQWRW